MKNYLDATKIVYCENKDNVNVIYFVNNEVMKLNADFSVLEAYFLERGFVSINDRYLVNEGYPEQFIKNQGSRATTSKKIKEIQ